MLDRHSKIYVAGHRGLVGSAIWNNLASRGYSNLVGRTHSELDLTDQLAVRRFFDEERPDAVVLAAAFVGGIMANSLYRADFIMQNMLIQCNVIGEAYRHGVRKLLFLGSTCIYPKNAPQPMTEDCLLTSPLEYTNEEYAIAKIAGLKMCESYNLQYGTNYIAVMPTNLYGPNDKHKVKLQVRLKNIFENKNIKIQLIYYQDSNKSIQQSDGETELGQFDPNKNVMTFTKFFIVDYFFEKEMPVEFRIIGDIESIINTSLPSIMGSRAQTYKKQIEGTDIILEIKGFSYESILFSNLKIDVEIKGKVSEKSLKYWIIAKGTKKEPLDQKLYISELRQVPKKEDHVNFKQVVIPDIFISPDGDYANCQLSIELLDCKKVKSLGCHKCYLSSLILNKTPIKFDSERTGIIFIDPIKNYSFIDYLRGGMQISLSLAIDFTASNEKPTDPKSLHYLSSYNNQYELAIKACGEIVAYYDYSQMFETYGFGGKFFGNLNVDHCFPLNCNFNNPQIFGLNEVLKRYREALNNCQLFGPTFFHYFLEKMNQKALKQVRNKDFSKYHILMILTDGIIEDTDETINALVEASFLPISVIIIGIGSADFSNMNILDADEEPLYDDKNRKASRDLVQFVPFNDYKNDPKKLAEQVLEEIPRQIVEYYQHQNIPPRDPIANSSFSN